MKNIHLVLIIAILVLVYLISMQWLREDANTTPTYTPYPQEVTEVSLPPVTIDTEEPLEIIEEESDIPVIETLTPEETMPETGPVVVEEAVNIDDSELIEYKNTRFGYHFSIPDQVYYAGFGAQNGAVHTIAIQTDALPESFEDSIVRVSYFGKKILPELQNTTRYVDPNGRYILLLLDNAYSVKIESNNLQSATVKTIETTIGVD